MMIINHVTEGTVSDHVIGGPIVIRFVIRFGYTYLGKVGNVANFVSGSEPIANLFQRPRILP